MGHRRAYRIAVLGVLGLLGPRTALASPSARLVYVRDPSAAACPDEPVLRKAVAVRVGYDPFFPWASQTVVASIAREQDRLVAHVGLSNAAGMSQGTRELRSPHDDCDELIDAMALAISIALDSAPPSEPPEPPPAPKPPEDNTAAMDPPSLPPPPVDTGVVPEPPLPPPVSTRRIVLGLDGRVSTGVAPSLATGGAFFAALRWSRWSVALEFDADAPASAPADGGGRVQSFLLLGTLAPCFHRGPFFGCGFVSLGQLRAQGLDVASPKPDNMFYAVLGPRLGAELPAGPVVLRAYGALLVPLQHEQLQLTRTAVWESPAVAASFGLGAAVHFE